MKNLTESQPKHNFTTIRTMWAFILVWQFVLVGITYHLIYGVEHTQGPPADNLLRNVLWVAGVLVAIVSVALPKYLGSQATGEFRVGRILISSILTIAFNTAIVMYGMIVASVYQNILQMVPFAAFGMINMLVHFPRVSLARWYYPKLTDE